MKVIIAGSRSITEAMIMQEAVQELRAIRIAEVVSGGARGIDRMGEAWAQAQGIPVRRFPADWHTYGRAAGPIRNRQMADYADVLLLVWDGRSRGSADMLKAARAAHLTIYQYRLEGLNG